MYRTLLADPPKYLVPLFVNRKSVTFAEGRWGVLLGCLLLSFGAVLAAGSLVEEVQRPAAPKHTKRLR